MGTRSSRHNKGRKPLYKDHRSVAAHLIAHPAYPGFNGCRGDNTKSENGWYNTRLWWKDADHFKLGILCEADSDIEQSADALGRKPSTLVWKARDLGLILPTQWSRLIKPKYTPRHRQPKEAIRNYPYIITPRDEHSDLLAVNAIVPKGIPDNMRADMCQEIMIAILEGRTTLEMLKAKNGSASY